MLIIPQIIRLHYFYDEIGNYFLCLQSDLLQTIISEHIIEIAIKAEWGLLFVIFA